ncbi:MAG: PspC domain-containing protein [Bacteroidota bacterium]|jgi:phage shock protein C
MNKTISVNIGGFVFHIEEQAYAELRQYLETISNGIPVNEGRQEIMSDIEARIAEIFKDSLQTSKREVVVAADVKSAVNTMGRPEEITDPFQQASEQKENTDSTTFSRPYKMLYRDGDERIIGGVCSGLGHYFGLNPILFRAAFVIAFVFWGSGLLLYLILLLIIPKAKTTAEKLEMRGRPVNLKEIRKNVEEEFGEISKSAEAGYAKVESEVKNSNWQGRVNGFFDMLGALFTRFFKIVAKFIAIMVWFVSVVLLLGVTAALFAKLFDSENVTVMDIGGMEFFDGNNANLFVIGICLLIGVPAVALTYITTKYIFGIKKSFKPMPWILSILFLAGLVCSMIAAISTAKDFKSKSIQSNRLPITQPVSDTLVVAMTKPMDDDYNDNDDDIIHINTPYFSDSIDAGKVKWDLISASADSFELKETRISRGRNEADAKENGSHVLYQLSQTGDTLFLDPVFTLGEDSKFRFQKLRISLAVPKGKAVKITHPANRYLRKIEGFGDDFEKRNSVGVWKNGENGIRCTDCPKEQFIEIDEEKVPSSMDIRVDTTGVRIKME